MNCRARIIAVCLFSILLSVSTRAQVHYQPTPTPTVTAEGEPWYLAGEPVMVNGNIYYPAGPQVHFMAFEMVRSGFYRGIPLYARTTIEPYSIVFVPLAGGVMQPYERRRAGDIAGTVGSTAPSFPTMRSFEPAADPVLTPQAPAPPRLAQAVPETPVPSLGVEPPATAPTSAGNPAGTTGYGAPRMPLESASRPTGPNGIYIDYQGRRWYSAGGAVRFDARTMQAIGEHRGFPVYARESGDEAIIYVPVTREAGSLVATYSKRRR